jgi:hypothetical protein
MLQPTGQIVASVPNVAHGSVRLALLGGLFPYDEAGLLDRTHLRFFTLASVRDMFEQSGYIVDRVERTYVPIDQAIPYDRQSLPKGLEEFVASMPEATTFQYVIVAHPDGSAPAEDTVADARSPEFVAKLDPMADSSELLRSQYLTILEMNRALAVMDSQLKAASQGHLFGRIGRLLRKRRSPGAH